MYKKILILRFSSIGDIVLTTPLIRCIKTQLNQVEVHYATKKQYASILESNPYIDKIHVLDGKNLPTLLNALEAENYDYIIDLHNNLRTFLIKGNLGIRSKSFNKLNFKKWLMVRFKLNRLPSTHIVDRYFEAASHLKIVNDGQGLDYFIADNDAVDLNTLPPIYKNNYVALVIGALHATKKLPNQKLIELCSKIRLPILLIGGPDDSENGDIIAASHSSNIYNACGKYTINQSAFLIQHAYKVITHDTGMMHIAAAYKKDIYSIWGNTIPAFGMYPYYGTAMNLKEQKKSHKILEVENLHCRPCSKIGYNKCPKKHFNCMNLQHFENIQLD